MQAEGLVAPEVGEAAVLVLVCVAAALWPGVFMQLLSSAAYCAMYGFLLWAGTIGLLVSAILVEMFFCGSTQLLGSVMMPATNTA